MDYKLIMKWNKTLNHLEQEVTGKKWCASEKSEMDAEHRQEGPCTGRTKE